MSTNTVYRLVSNLLGGEEFATLGELQAVADGFGIDLEFVGDRVFARWVREWDDEARELTELVAVLHTDDDNDEAAEADEAEADNDDDSEAYDGDEEADDNDEGDDNDDEETYEDSEDDEEAELEGNMAVDTKDHFAVMGGVPAQLRDYVSYTYSTVRYGRISVVQLPDGAVWIDDHINGDVYEYATPDGPLYFVGAGDGVFYVQS